MRLDHVALTVADRERSARFYGEHFGFTRRLHDDPHLLIISSPNGGLIALSEGAAPTPLPRTNHFGFQTSDPEVVRDARERFAREAVLELEWQDDGGFVRVQVLDPDGYRVEVYALPG